MSLRMRMMFCFEIPTVVAIVMAVYGLLNQEWPMAVSGGLFAVGLYWVEFYVGSMLRLFSAMLAGSMAILLLGNFYTNFELLFFVIMLTTMGIPFSRRLAYDIDEIFGTDE